MLMTFSCQAYANVTVFGDVGTKLLEMMGCQNAAKGAISADSVPAALERLEEAVEAGKAKQAPKANQDAAFGDESVSMASRALPLIELLKSAAQEKCNVWWETK